MTRGFSGVHPIPPSNLKRTADCFEAEELDLVEGPDLAEVPDLVEEPELPSGLRFLGRLAKLIANVSLSKYGNSLKRSCPQGKAVSQTSPLRPSFSACTDLSCLVVLPDHRGYLLAPLFSLPLVASEYVILPHFAPVPCSFAQLDVPLATRTVSVPRVEEHAPRVLEQLLASDLFASRHHPNQADVSGTVGL